MSDQKVRYYTINDSIGLAHQITKAWSVTAQTGTTFASGRDSASRRPHPPLRGWLAGAATGYSYPLSARDGLFSNLLVKAWSSQGNEVATLNATESWSHQFAPRTSAPSVPA